MEDVVEGNDDGFHDDDDSSNGYFRKDSKMMTVFILQELVWPLVSVTCNYSSF